MEDSDLDGFSSSNEEEVSERTLSGRARPPVRVTISKVGNDKKRKAQQLTTPVVLYSKEDRIQRMVRRLTEKFRLKPRESIQYSNFVLNGGHSTSGDNPFLSWSIEINIKLKQLDRERNPFEVSFWIDNFPRILPFRRTNVNIGYITIESQMIKTNFYNNLDIAVQDLTEIITSIHSDNTFFLETIYYPFLDNFSDISACQNCLEYTSITRCDRCKSAYCLTCLLRYCNKIQRNGTGYYSIKNICACRSTFRIYMHSDIAPIYNDVKEWEGGNDPLTIDFFIDDDDSDNDGQLI